MRKRPPHFLHTLLLSLNWRPLFLYQPWNERDIGFFWWECIWRNIEIILPLLKPFIVAQCLSRGIENNFEHKLYTIHDATIVYHLRWLKNNNHSKWKLKRLYVLTPVPMHNICKEKKEMYFFSSSNLIKSGFFFFAQLFFLTLYAWLLGNTTSSKRQGILSMWGTGEFFHLSSEIA